jgi:endo-1,3-1,4-beta-glycanase ExoK
VTFARITASGALAAAFLSSVTLTAAAQNKAYKGGELYSQQAVLYGRMEMRMRMARGSGLLSTFFTYKNGSEGSGTFWEEIDIEVFGKEDATVWQSNIITGLGTRVTTEAEHTHPTSLADGYHTYALVWTPDYVAWELDNNEIRRVESTQVADLTNPQSLRFNIWAANIVEWVGDFDTSALPQYQYVNWISYSRYENGQFVHEWTDDFNSLDTGRWGRADWTFAENLVDFDPNNVVVTDGTLVLALTHQGMTGFSGSVPVDPGPMEPEPGGTGGQDSGSGGAGSGGTGAGGTTGGSGGLGAGGQTSADTGGSDPVGPEPSGGAPASGSGSGGIGPASGGETGATTGGQSSDLGVGEEGGCGCRNAPAAFGPRGAFFSVAVLLVALSRRRKQARTRVES